MYNDAYKGCTRREAYFAVLSPGFCALLKKYKVPQHLLKDLFWKFQKYVLWYGGNSPTKVINMAKQLGLNNDNT